MVQRSPGFRKMFTTQENARMCCKTRKWKVTRTVSARARAALLGAAGPSAGTAGPAGAATPAAAASGASPAGAPPTAGTAGAAAPGGTTGTAAPAAPAAASSGAYLANLNLSRRRQLASLALA